MKLPMGDASAGIGKENPAVGCRIYIVGEADGDAGDGVEAHPASALGIDRYETSDRVRHPQSALAVEIEPERPAPGVGEALDSEVSRGWNQTADRAVREPAVEATESVELDVLGTG